MAVISTLNAIAEDSIASFNAITANTIATWNGIEWVHGYVIEGSGLFNGSDSVLKRTFKAGNTKIFTVSVIVKFNVGGDAKTIFRAGTNDSTNIDVLQLSSGMLDFQMYHDSALKGRLRTTQLIRDFSAYYHIVVAVNTNAAIAAANRLRMYINGTEVTDFETRSNPGNNQVFLMNSAVGHSIGAGLSDYFTDAYYANVTFIDGLQLTPTSFGETTSDGYWQINDVSDLTFGTNGFLIEGGVNVAAGKDSSYTEPTSYVPVSVAFDGDNDSLVRGADLTGLSDVNTITIAGWFKLNSLGSTQEIVCFGNDKTTAYIAASNDLRFFSRNADNSIEQSFISGTIFKVGIWYHFALSSNGTTQQMFINGVSDLVTDTYNNNDTLALTEGNVGIGCRSTGPDQLFDGDLADIMMDDTRIDLSNATNLAKFISATGEPVDPGSDGSTPFGASPLIYLNSNALATWHTNSGTGGGFTENGALTAGSTVRGTGANDFSPTGTITATKDSPTNGDA